MILIKKKIEFNVSGQKLTGTLQFLQSESSNGQSPGVLFIHGWTSSETGYIPRAEAVSKLGFTCLTFNLRGHGISEGDLESLSRKDHLDDCMAAYDLLVAHRNVDQSKIGIVGSSYGGYIAALLTQKRNIKWLVLKSPANYPDENFNTISAQEIVMVARSKKYRSRPLKPNKSLALSATAEFTGELLIIEAEKDEVIPKQCLLNYANALHDKSKLTYEIIKDADHASTREEWNQEFINILKEWFRQSLDLNQRV